MSTSDIICTHMYVYVLTRKGGVERRAEDKRMERREKRREREGREKKGGSRGRGRGRKGEGRRKGGKGAGIASFSCFHCPVFENAKVELARGKAQSIYHPNIYQHVDRQEGGRLKEQAARSLSFSVCPSTGVLNVPEDEN